MNNQPTTENTMNNTATVAKDAHDRHFNPLHPWMSACDTLQIEPGESLREDNPTLPRDAYLIAANRYSDHPSDRHLWIVLCAWDRGSAVEYVTWRMNDGRQGDVPGCYIRHDYETLAEAVTGFWARRSA